MGSARSLLLRVVELEKGGQESLIKDRTVKLGKKSPPTRGLWEKMHCRQVE